MPTPPPPEKKFSQIFWPIVFIAQENIVWISFRVFPSKVTLLPYKAFMLHLRRVFFKVFIENLKNWNLKDLDKGSDNAVLNTVLTNTFKYSSN